MSTTGFTLPDQFRFAKNLETVIETTSQSSNDLRVVGASRIADERDKLSPMEFFDNSDVELFRNVHVQQSRPAIKSLAEAKALLSEEPEHSKALQYLGWCQLWQTQDYETAEHLLNRSIRSSMDHFTLS